MGVVYRENIGDTRNTELFGEPGSHVVALSFKSELLRERQEDLLQMGATTDWPEYRPHIAIGAAAQDLEIVKPWEGEIVLGSEVFGEAKIDGVKTPGTLYVHRPVINSDGIMNWYYVQGVDVNDHNEYHVTIVWSKTDAPGAAPMRNVIFLE